ncbi:MAG: M20 family metallo-hydrolase [Cuniculiplasma divulgatum]|jgi:succinyl-diaminopimelate desuccinylase
MNLKDITDEKEFIIELAKRIIPVKSISPASGGQGESQRADLLVSILKELGYEDSVRYDVEDKMGFKRSSVIEKVGNFDRTLWLVSHIDTVPDGDPNLWTRPPFQATVEGNRIYGRGTSDDGQAVFLSLLLLKKLDKSKLKMNLGLAFVADEEVGSVYGIQYLLDKNIFKKDDLIIVPDAGSMDGMELEIAEKSIVWIKFTVNGRQYHASMPSNAISAARDGMEFMLSVDKMLHSKYTDKDDTFNFPYSTFEPTKHEKNVDNINTIPGKEVFYMDCRILPNYDVDSVVDDISREISEFERTHKSKIKMEFVQREQAPVPTSRDSEVVTRLVKALSSRGGEPKVVGIGGGTCAAFFRRLGYDAVVWCTTVPDVAHQVDEYVIIDQILQDRETIEKLVYSE